MTEETEDTILIDSAKKGSKDAFGRLYKKYYNRIYRYCRISLYRDEAAEDVAQETFVRAWKALPAFSNRSIGTFQAYLFRIARNLIIDLSRRKRDYSLDPENEIEYEATFENDLAKLDTIRTVRIAMSQLKDIERQILILRYFEELDYNEISKILGVNTGALRVRMNRLLKTLKSNMTIHE